jgi:hypothetical protein
MRSAWRAWLGLGLLSVAVGVAMTIGVAWGLAYLVEPSSWPQYEMIHAEEGLWIQVFSYSDPGAARTNFSCDSTYDHAALYAEFIHTPATQEARGLDARRHAPGDAWIEQARGWPWTAMWCEVSKNDPFRWQGGLEWRAPSGITTPRLTALPLRPLWPWFGVDAAFWATVFVAAVLVLRGVRWRARRRGGKCLECGYDLRGLGAGLERGAKCPECGVGIER